MFKTFLFSLVASKGTQYKINEHRTSKNYHCLPPFGQSRLENKASFLFVRVFFNCIMSH